MQHKPLIAGAVAVAVGLAAAVVGVAVPAQAATGNCPSGYTCIWRDANYVSSGNGAGLVKFGHYIPNYSAHSYAVVGGGANDTASSAYNNGVSEMSRVFEHATQGGRYFTMDRRQGTANLSNVSGNLNDLVSSGYFSSCWNKSCW